MTITSGALVGPYEIGDLIGAGGMGNVYRARDVRLNRSVAVKVLSGEMADNMERRQRFEREAQIIATLNFAVGATFYEMLSGKKAFDGKSQASLIAAIMHVDPQPFSTVHVHSPALLESIIRKCLAKDPVDRWQSAGDLLDVLQWRNTDAALAGRPGINVAR